jgi:hypothetical protein
MGPWPWVAAVQYGDTTTNQKLVLAVGGTSGKALDHGGTCVGGVLL